MANREKGEASIDVDGVSYTLSVNTNALCEIETLFSVGGKDVTFQEILQRAAHGHLVSARGVFWAMLRQHHPEVSIKDAGRLLDRLGTTELERQLTDLMPHATPNPKDAETLKEDLPKGRPRTARGNARAAAGTGTTSSVTRSGLA